MLSVNGDDILTPTNVLQWVLDKSYGYTKSPDSRLIVGPIGEDDDHSTYQCSISLPNEATVGSTIALLTIKGTVTPLHIYMHIELFIYIIELNALWLICM